MIEEIGLYLHFPFCKRKCDYCDFNSYSGMENLMAPYAKALIAEMDSYLPISRPVKSVFFGGGTPSLFPVDLLVYLLHFIKEKFFCLDELETTLEVNPGTISPEALIVLKNAGFNRLSIGLQAVQDRLLKTIGRIHRWSEFQQVYKIAREIGFHNIGVDLIFGLPGQSLKDWDESLVEVIGLQPEHISCYGLQLEEGTPLELRVKEGELSLPSEEVTVAMMQMAMERLPEGGYERYEISNYAKPGYESRHNTLYWKGGDYLGFGAGAYSTLHQNRWVNIGDPGCYIDLKNKKQPVIVESEMIDWKTEIVERMMLGLRLKNGINLQEFQENYKINFTREFNKNLIFFVDNGLLKQENGSLSLTNQGVLISNYVIGRLIAEI